LGKQDIFKAIWESFIKAVLHLQRFMDLLSIKRGSPAAGPVGRSN
jgi:hypothetical protein